jgi:phospholipase C
VGAGSSGIQLTVNSAGTGTGTVTSNPAGINCPQTCTASFPKGTAVVLAATPGSGDTFAGWSGVCTGVGSCRLTLEVSTSVTPTFEQGTADITSLQHIIFFAQENRSLDDYFGAMREYWKENGIPDQSFDGLPQFNPTSGAAPLYGPPPPQPGCKTTRPYPGPCIWDTSNTVASLHMISVCNENTSPSWNEAHVDWNFGDQVGKYPAKNNGFVHTAAGDARKNPGSPFFDTNGIRAMGYWDGTDLNYDYFMASNFATSDRFFHPAMSRTEINREYLDGATSGGYAYPNGTNAKDTPQLKSKPIFEELQDAGITWKYYINPEGTGCTGPPYNVACLLRTTDLAAFTYASLIVSKYAANIAPISEYFSDLENGTLPQVAEIYAASDAGLDEHGSDSDRIPTNVQAGARYTSTLINALMNSSSWENSAFIFTFDESGGLYDHVPPQPTVSPDGIPPIDLQPGDVCNNGYTGPTCNFIYTGYRIPLTVISPYAKKNYVSHTVMDSTAIVKFIETRFNLPPLTKRDAAQPDMTEFFDFNNPPWMSPPVPPQQNMKNPCYLNKVP